MPTNKDAKFRFDIIDDCLRNTKKKWTKAVLLQYVNRKLELHYGEDTTISASQLRYDLIHMETEFGAPIRMYREGRNHYYEYSDADFSIKNITLDAQDIETMNKAIDTLEEANVQYLANEMKELLNKLKGNDNTADEA